MNTERILELAGHIEDEATTFDMSKYWFGGCHARNICESASCLAGHAVVYFGDTDLLKQSALMNLGQSLFAFANWTHDFAAELLGLGKEQAHDLFIPDEDMFDYTEITQQEAAKVLRHLAATGKVDWAKFYDGPVPGDEDEQHEG